MSDKHLLRRTRKGTVINVTSKKQESRIIRALERVVGQLSKKYAFKISHHGSWYLKDIVAMLRKSFPDVRFHYYFDTSNIRPDGGILFIQDRQGREYPILIAEVKNQGTNDMRLKEGLAPQARGNAIERLGKNVIGLRTALSAESIFPFVCFGYGCDFADSSSILDRVVTIGMFGKLNTTYLFNEGDGGKFNRGSFYFRARQWTVKEMAEVMYDIASRSVMYYFSKYREGHFVAR